MLFASWLRTSLSPRRVAAWATEVAQHCQADVAARLRPTFHAMSLSEAKGYIRARAAAVLDQQIMLLADPIGSNPELQLAVRKQATEQRSATSLECGASAPSSMRLGQNKSLLLSLLVALATLPLLAAAQQQQQRKSPDPPQVSSQKTSAPASGAVSTHAHP